MRARLFVVLIAALFVLLDAPGLSAQEEVISATYRGLQPVVKFDVSPPLRSMPPLPVKEGGEAMVDPDGPPGELGPQDIDLVVQGWTGGAEAIPTPIVSFDGPSNLSGVSPPDPVGDVGPNHYVAMSNLSFADLRQDRSARSTARWPTTRCGPASAATARPTTPATRSCSTTSSPTAGS